MPPRTEAAGLAAATPENAAIIALDARGETLSSWILPVALMAVSSLRRLSLPNLALPELALRYAAFWPPLLPIALAPAAIAFTMLW